MKHPDPLFIWTARLIRRYRPARSIQDWSMARIELRMKELQILLFIIVVGGTATILDALLN